MFLKNAKILSKDVLTIAIMNDLMPTSYWKIPGCNKVENPSVAD